MQTFRKIQMELEQSNDIGQIFKDIQQYYNIYAPYVSRVGIEYDKKGQFAVDLSKGK